MTTVRCAAGQADFVQVTTFQWSCLPARSKAGSHCSACESPKRTTVREALGSPNTQAPWFISRKSRWHPLADAAGVSPPACSGCGTRLRGAAVTANPDLTPAFTSARNAAFAVGSATVAIRPAARWVSGPEPTNDGGLAATTSALAATAP